MSEIQIRHYHDGIFTWEDAPFADECRVDIFVNQRRQASVMATPAQLDCLAGGFLFGEGLINNVSDIISLEVQGLIVKAEIKKTAATAEKSISLESVEPEALPSAILNHPKVDASGIMDLSEDFNSHSYLFRQTGAVHSCCLVSGNNRYFADDVGRHNALDKVIGQYLMKGLSDEPGLVLTTGRISTEILIKSAKAGMGMVISRSAATDRAVELARRLNMIMIGFSRGDRFNVYHGGEAISGVPPLPA